MSYFAEIDPVTKEAIRVIVADDVQWCIDHHGGMWAETADPYSVEPQTVVYCGPGYGYDPGVPERFCNEHWDAATAQTMQPDGAGNFYWLHNTLGKLVFHNAKMWRNLSPTGTPNVWEPPTNWREYPMGTEHPLWVQPVGSVDAYPLDFVVEHDGKVWKSLVPANAWQPGTNATLWEDISPAAEEPTIEAWKPWTGINADLYQIGDKVTHNGQTWESTASNNHWEPGVYGWVVI
jgi:hypothetical protein